MRALFGTSLCNFIRYIHQDGLGLFIVFVLGYQIRGVVISVRQAWSNIRGIECGELAMKTQQPIYGALGVSQREQALRMPFAFTSLPKDTCEGEGGV